MATPKVWKGVKVSMQSAIAAAVVVTGITNASPAVVTAAAPPANGSFVLINCPTISQLDGRIFRVAASMAGSFALDLEDSTLYDVFVAGSVASFQVVTLAIPISSMTTVSASGGDYSFIDTTTIHATQKSQIPGLANAVTYTSEHIEDASDPGQQALKSANDVQAPRAFKFTFQNGSFFVFNAYVGFSGIPTGQAQALVTASSVLTVNKPVTKYAA